MFSYTWLQTGFSQFIKMRWKIFGFASLSATILDRYLTFAFHYIYIYIYIY